MPKKGLNLPKEKIITAPANLIKRLLAFFIDLILISFIISPLENLIRSIIPKTTTYKETLLALTNTQYSSVLMAVSISIILIAILYFSILEFKINQTVGKMIANLYVVSESKSLRYWQCLVRNLFLLPFLPFVLLWIIDPLYAIFTKENKRFSDVLAKTKVIEYYKM